MIITFYDVETSGLDQHYDDILQLAYLTVDTETRKILRKNSFYMWEEGFRWSKAAYDVHGISKEFLRQQPLEEMAKKYQEIYAIFNRANVVGFNNNRYDDVLLNSFMQRHAKPITIDSSQDVMLVAKEVLGLKKFPKLVDVPPMLGITENTIQMIQNFIFKSKTEAHDASYDVTATALCLGELLKRK